MFWIKIVYSQFKTWWFKAWMISLRAYFHNLFRVYIPCKILWHKWMWVPTRHMFDKNKNWENYQIFCKRCWKDLYFIKNWENIKAG